MTKNGSTSRRDVVLVTLHIMRERDVGLFSLIQQVVANVSWALGERRVPVADFRERCAYWTPHGHREGTSVWEYYFEPVVAQFPAASISPVLRSAIEKRFPDQNDLGYQLKGAFVTNHYGDHPALAGKAPVIPFESGHPSPELRRETCRIISEFIRPRTYILDEAEAFFAAHMSGTDVIGVHIRGTDAVSAEETRQYRHGSLSLTRYVEVIERLLFEQPAAKVFVATDAEASLEFMVHRFGNRVIAYDALRHVDGDPAGQGPTGCIMPGYITGDGAAAAQNGEDAVVEYLLLRRCSHLVHNGASLAVTVLLAEPELLHTNTHAHG